MSIIILNLKRRSSGISSTILALQPILENLRDDIYYVGTNTKQTHRQISIWQFFQLFFKKTPKTLVIHARRNHEILICILLKYVSRRPVKIIFTFAAQRPKGMLSGMICGRSNVIVSTSKKSAIYAPFTTTIIPHGVHILPCETRSIQNNTVKIAIIGRIRPEKGIDIFVDALLNIKHHNFHAYIIGLTQKKYEAFKEKITKKIYQHGANDHFTWTEMAHGDLVTFLRTVDIVVACPRYEGFGLTLFEAAAAGCAIIGSNTGAFADLIGDGHDRGILIHCGDVQALQDAIERLLMDPQMMINLGVKAQKYVQENFSIHHEAMSLLKVYQKAIE